MEQYPQLSYCGSFIVEYLTSAFQVQELIFGELQVASFYSYLYYLPQEQSLQVSFCPCL